MPIVRGAYHLRHFYLHNTHGNLAWYWQQGGASAPKRLSLHRVLVKRKGRRKTCVAVNKQIQFQCY